MRAGQLQAFRRGELVASVHSDGQGRVGLKAGGDGQQFGNRVAAMAHVYDKGAPGLGNLAQFAYAFLPAMQGAAHSRTARPAQNRVFFMRAPFKWVKFPHGSAGRGKRTVRRPPFRRISPCRAEKPRFGLLTRERGGKFPLYRKSIDDMQCRALPPAGQSVSRGTRLLRRHAARGARCLGADVFRPFPAGRGVVSPVFVFLPGASPGLR